MKLLALLPLLALVGFLLFATRRARTLRDAPSQPIPDPTSPDWVPPTTLNPDGQPSDAAARFDAYATRWIHDRPADLADRLYKVHGPAVVAYFNTHGHEGYPSATLWEVYLHGFYLGKSAGVAGLTTADTVKNQVVETTIRHCAPVLGTHTTTTGAPDGNRDVYLAAFMGLRFGVTGTPSTLLDPALVGHDDLFDVD